MTADQLFTFYDARFDFWPVDVYKDHEIYFISSDKKQVWKVTPAKKELMILDPADAPHIAGRVAGYSDEFFPLFPDVDEVSVPTFVQVITQADLLNEQNYDHYIYLGTYDKFLSYTHEGFHIFGQVDGENVW